MQNNEDPKFWARLLKKLNLKMTRGYDPDKIAYIGGSNELQHQSEVNIRKISGKIASKKHGPDQE